MTGCAASIRRRRRANLTAILDTLAAQAHPGPAGRHVCAAQSGAGLREGIPAVFDRLGQRPGVLYDPFFLEGVATIPALNQPDGLHPNADGREADRRPAAAVVEKLLAEVPPA